MKAITKTLLVAASGAALSAPALADEPLKSEIGVSTVIGGGVTGFTDQTMRDTTSNVGGLWNLKVTIGSHSPFALDLSYVGTAADVNALAGPQNGTLIGSTAEGALRYNIMAYKAFNPYAFAGIGYQRYDINGGNFTLSDTGVSQSDNSVVFPMGAGIAYRYNTGLVLDLHGTFRASADYGLVLENMNSNDYAPMHSWEASAAVGYEF